MGFAEVTKGPPLPDCPKCKTAATIDSCFVDNVDNRKSYVIIYIDCLCDESPMLIEDRLDTANGYLALEVAWRAYEASRLCNENFNTDQEG